MFTPCDASVRDNYTFNVRWQGSASGQSEFKFNICNAPGFQSRYTGQIKLIIPSPGSAKYPGGKTLYLPICKPAYIETCQFQPGPAGCIIGSVFGNFTYDNTALLPPVAKMDITSNPPSAAVMHLCLN